MEFVVKFYRKKWFLTLISFPKIKKWNHDSADDYFIDGSKFHIYIYSFEPYSANSVWHFTHFTVIALDQLIK